MKARQSLDNVAWDKNDDAWEKSQKQLRLKSTCRKVEALAETVLGKKSASLVSPIFFGGFNVLYRISFEHKSSDIIVRLPCPDLVQFPEEKTCYEAATMAYLAQNTSIPVPALLYYTSSSDVGPALILQHIKYAWDMSDTLAIPGQDPEETPVLNPNIEEDTLQKLYQKIAVILSQLFKPTFTRIGSLIEDENGCCSVAGRPITQNMNNMIQLANIPKAVLPEPHQTYESANSWYTASSEMHMAQLLFQHNDLVRSENDCRNKYVARFLFHSLAKQGRLSSFGFSEDDWSAQSRVSKFTCAMPKESDGFRLWCDDLRPVNLLVNQEDDIIAAIDWELIGSLHMLHPRNSAWILLGGCYWRPQRCGRKESTAGLTFMVSDLRPGCLRWKTLRMTKPGLHRLSYLLTCVRAGPAVGSGSITQRGRVGLLMQSIGSSWMKDSLVPGTL
ncbi:hypothetical protein QX201_007867 [Fusarium graminearum]